MKKKLIKNSIILIQITKKRNCLDFYFVYFVLLFVKKIIFHFYIFLFIKEKKN